jgi:hypothetical protein
MTNVEKAKAQTIIDELGPIIREVVERHGLATPQMQWKYGAHFELKLSAALLEEGPHGINLGSIEATYFKKFGFYGLNAPLGTVFMSKHDSYVFAGIASKRPKYPIYAKNLLQGTYHFFPEGIIPSINAAAEKATV